MSVKAGMTRVDGECIQRKTWGGIGVSETEKLVNILKDSTRAVFFCGAGMSTDSGIPDFRSADGIYHQKLHRKFHPEEMAAHSFLVNHPEEFFEFYRQRMMFMNAQPNCPVFVEIRLIALQT